MNRRSQESCSISAVVVFAALQSLLHLIVAAVLSHIPLALQISVAKDEYHRLLQRLHLCLSFRSTLHVRDIVRTSQYLTCKLNIYIHE